MSYVAVPGLLLGNTELTLINATSTLDAAGESVALVGTAYVPGGGSKTISSSGGAIFIRTGNPITFSNGSTNLRMGVQDVSASTGLEDNTFDVQADWVGNVDTIAGNTFYKVPMESGSKTIAHGDLIAIVVEMTGRGGTDSVLLVRYASIQPNANSGIMPYGTADTGTLAKVGTLLWAEILFDDGTLGWIQGSQQVLPTSATTAFNSGSTPDEYAAQFTAPVNMKINGIGIGGGAMASGDNFELILYSDPAGTPSPVVTVTPDTDQLENTLTNAPLIYTIAEQTLTAGSKYAIALRPTTTNNINVAYLDLNATANVALKQRNFFGASLQLVSRTNQTGAFSNVSDADWPLFLLSVSALVDADSGGGGFVGIIGG